MKNTTSLSSRLLLSLLTICLTSFSFGQVEVSGQIKDETSKENMPYCKVVALTMNDSIVAGGITDDKGFFKLPLNPGAYKLAMSFYGYHADTVHAQVSRSDVFLGVYKLKVDAVNLEQMNVEASSRIDYLDKDVQVVTDVHKKGTTAAKDVLRKLPGITFDDYSGQLKIDSDANIMILVNGVEKSQEYVQNLDPDRLLRVETTRDPGGRYGLEGYTAILNIVLKGNYKGSEVYLEQMQLVDIDTDRSRLDYMIGSIGGTYNFTRDNLNLYAGAWFERRRFQISTDSRTDYDDGYHVLEISEGDDPNGIILEYNLDYNLGFDYRINPKHLISFESNISGMPRLEADYNFGYNTEVYQGDSLLDSFRFDTQTKDKTFNIYNTLFYIADFNDRNKLNVNFTYSNYNEEYTSITDQEDVFYRDEAGLNKKQYTRLYAEFDHILTPKASIQIGYGNTWRDINNSYDVIQTNIVTSDEISFEDDFSLTDMRHKLYSNYSWKLSNKWGMRVGIASETSSPRANGTKNDYIIFQPLFDLRYVAGKKFNLKLKYRTASSYPTIDQTNPFLSVINPRMTSTGNPFLKPSTTHRFSLRINALQGLFSVEPYFHYSNNTVAQIGELDENNIFNFRYENIKDYQRVGGNLNFNKYFKFNLLIQANLEVFYTQMNSDISSNSFMDWSADADLIYIFGKSQSLLGLKYQKELVKRISALGYNIGDVDFWMLFYKQPLFKQRASVMVGYFLPIDFGTKYNQASAVDGQGFSMRTDNDVSLIKNMFLVEFSFRFNKGKSIKKTEKNVDQESEDGGGGLF